MLQNNQFTRIYVKLGYSNEIDLKLPYPNPCSPGSFIYLNEEGPYQ